MTWVTTPIQVPKRTIRFSDNQIRFVWVTDSHLVDDLGNRDKNLRLAVDDCNTWLPNAFIHTGDLGDNFLSRIQRSFYNLMNCQRPVYAIKGNHDEYEQVFGEPNTNSLDEFNTFNRNPFYYTETLSSPDGSWTARCLFLDCNYYDDDPDTPPPGNSSEHNPGDRIGWSTSEPGGGFWRRFGETQLTWVETTLAADNTSDAILVFVHYPPAGVTCTDYASLGTLLTIDGRPTMGFCGHVHPNATSYNLSGITFYKNPAMQESGCWTRVAISFDGSIQIEEMIIKNYIDPASWVINTPFTVE